ncbi:hypothetical protein ABIA39_000381 [Nocardia sp. GAS34]
MLETGHRRVSGSMLVASVLPLAVVLGTGHTNASPVDAAWAPAAPPTTASPTPVFPLSSPSILAPDDHPLAGIVPPITLPSVVPPVALPNIAPSIALPTIALPVVPPSIVPPSIMRAVAPPTGPATVGGRRGGQAGTVGPHAVVIPQSIPADSPGLTHPVQTICQYIPADPTRCTATVVDAGVGAAIGAGIGAGLSIPLAIPAALVGAVAGGIVGIPFLPTGVVVGPLLGAAVGVAVVAAPAALLGAALGASVGTIVGVTAPLPAGNHAGAPVPPVSGPVVR